MSLTVLLNRIQDYIQAQLSVPPATLLFIHTMTSLNVDSNAKPKMLRTGWGASWPNSKRSILALKSWSRASLVTFSATLCARIGGVAGGVLPHKSTQAWTNIIQWYSG